MTQEEINTGNKLIAEWMGLHRGKKNPTYPFVKPNTIIGYKEPQYHSSWDWQIPVWRKVNLAVKDAIEKMKNAKPGLYFTDEEGFLSNICDEYAKAVFQNNPEKGMQVIINAITWLNQQK